MLKTFLVACVAMLLALPAVADETWHVKGFHGDGAILGVKAIGTDGKMHDIKATRVEGGGQIMGIKALVDGASLPVKLIDQGGRYLSVKAIRTDGTLMDVKAIDSDGHKLDVKGIGQDGHVVHIKAIREDGDRFHGVKAFGPGGRTYDVKGLRLSEGDHEGEVHGVKFHGHVKAIPAGD